MAKGNKGQNSSTGRNDSRTNGKASKKYPKVFSPQKRRLVTDK